MDITIRNLSSNEVATALELIWEVFMEFEAPDYSPEGINEFRGFLDKQDEIRKLRFFGALRQNQIVGILAMRQDHISLLFVRKEFHRQGIAKKLFRHMLSQIKSDKITVNSSPYALVIYGKLSFTATNTEQITNGIRYTPMIYTRMDFKTCITSSPAILMEGALGERIKREFNINIDGIIAMAGLVFEENGRIALKSLWQEYIDISRKYHLPFIATTPTRRANQERVKSAGYDKSIIYRNVEFLQTIKETSNIEMYVGGLLGCKGDAYTGEGALNTEEAKAFHSWQVDLFKDRKVDFLYAGIMPCLPEAIGMAMAIAKTNIPYIISFTIQEDGKLIDGHTIDFAISAIDNNVRNKPIGYMTNCVHPTIVHKALSHPFNQTETVYTRFIGIQGNTSALSYSELDGAHDLKESSPSDYANDTMKLVIDYKLQIVGGCCGTNGKHMEEIAKRLKNDGKQRINL